MHEALGQPREHSDEWWQLFKYGAKPLETPPGAWPSAGEILQRLRDQGPRLEAAIAAADEQALAAPNPSPAPHRPDTVRGWIVHTIQHENLHLGMISSMRNMLKRLG